MAEKEENSLERGRFSGSAGCRILSTQEEQPCDSLQRIKSNENISQDNTTKNHSEQSAGNFKVRINFSLILMYYLSITSCLSGRSGIHMYSKSLLVLYFCFCTYQSFFSRAHLQSFHFFHRRQKYD